MKRKISWNIKIQLYLPPKNRNVSLKIRKEIMIGVNEDEVKLNSKTRGSRAGRKHRCGQVKQKKML